jgi:hypothetical protein
MAALTVTAANVSADWGQGAIIQNYQAAEALTVGNVVALDSDGKLVKADANASLAKSRAIGIVVQTTDLYGSTSVAAGGYCSVCTFGPVYGFSSLAEGTYGWVGTTPGELVDAAPSTAYQFIVGQCIAADTFFVRPGIENPVSAA